MHQNFELTSREILTYLRVKHKTYKRSTMLGGGGGVVVELNSAASGNNIN